jgi:predicted transcriptional regulator
MSKQEEEWTKTTFRMPKELLREVKHFAVDNDMTDTEVFVQALKDWMAKEAKKK